MSSPDRLVQKVIWYNVGESSTGDGYVNAERDQLSLMPKIGGIARHLIDCLPAPMLVQDTLQRQAAMVYDQGTPDSVPIPRIKWHSYELVTMHEEISRTHFERLREQIDRLPGEQ